MSLLYRPFQPIVVNLTERHVSIEDLASALGMIERQLRGCLMQAELAAPQDTLFLLTRLPALLRFLKWTEEDIHLAVAQMRPQEVVFEMEGEETTQKRPRSPTPPPPVTMLALPFEVSPKKRIRTSRGGWYVMLGKAPWNTNDKWDVRGSHLRVTAADLARALDMVWPDFEDACEAIGITFPQNLEVHCWFAVLEIPALLEHLGWDQAKRDAAMEQFAECHRTLDPIGESQRTKPRRYMRTKLRNTPKPVHLLPPPPPPSLGNNGSDLDWFFDWTRHVEHYLDPAAVSLFMRTPEWATIKAQVMEDDLNKWEAQHLGPHAIASFMKTDEFAALIEQTKSTILDEVVDGFLAKKKMVKK